MRFGRIAISAFCGALVVINGPLSLYRAITDQVTPYGWHSRVYWLAATVANVVVGVLGVRFVFRADRREWRLATGKCIRCGYDLRATPGACPECGNSSTIPIHRPLR